MMQPYHGVVIATKPTVVPAPLKRAASVARPKTAAALPAVASAVVALANVPDSDRQRILAMGGSTLVAERICQKYGDDPAYLRCQLDFVEARIRSITSASPVNKIAFLQKALTNGYADTASSPITPIKAVFQEAAPSAATIEEQQKVLRRRAEVWQKFQSLADDDGRTALAAAFLEQTSPTLKTFYKKNGVNNMIVRMGLTDWLIREQSY